MGIGSFEHQTFAQRVVFGAGTAMTSLVTEADRLGARRVLLIATHAEAELADRLAGALPVSGRFHDVRPHVPAEVAEAARALAQEIEADLLVCIGGGSTTGTAKAVALTTGLPILAVPTTYAGSEATPVWGMTEARRKTTGTDPVVLPRVIVYDPELSVSLPTALAVASGLNAMAHCVDSLWAPRANPLLSAMATEGIRALAPALRGIVADAGDLDARAGCLYGAYLSASTFAGAGSGLHHKICHVLGGAYDLPHADTHAVVLPHVLAYNADDAPRAADRVAEALGAAESVAGLIDLYDDLAAPRALRDLGLREDQLEEATGLVVDAAPADNPRAVTAESIHRLLRRAWSGAAPLRAADDERNPS
ncbi:maleylacetate reductase [Nocardioides conyzicola]|uniref:Maleylacetate reductase n=1 Tax=Nocardioides conyzicola TaxID=1651781 RepID=A0ABP8XBR5_9ACTN